MAQDKGGGTFEMAVRIVNVLHPITPNNTCVLEGPDSVTNMASTIQQSRVQGVEVNIP